VSLPDHLLGAMRSFAGKPGADNARALHLGRKVPRSRRDLRRLQERRRQLLRATVRPGDGDVAARRLRGLDAQIARVRAGHYRDVVPVYLPTLLFGRAAGLSREAVNILTSSLREIQVAGSSAGRTRGLTGPIPLNGSRGTGYRLLTRMTRAGYEAPPQVEQERYKTLPPRGRKLVRRWQRRAYWRSAHRYLRQLGALAREFGLTAQARLEGQAIDLAAALRRTRTAAGRAWLERCTLHLYAPGDFRARWRQRLLELAGFAVEPPSPPANPPSDSSTLREWLEDMDLTQCAAAGLLGVSHSFVSKILNGKRPLPATMAERMRAARAARHPSPTGQPLCPPNVGGCD
jgi:hypothetical protein